MTLLDILASLRLLTREDVSGNDREDCKCLNMRPSLFIASIHAHAGCALNHTMASSAHNSMAGLTSSHHPPTDLLCKIARSWSYGTCLLILSLTFDVGDAFANSAIHLHVFRSEQLKVLMA